METEITPLYNRSYGLIYC